MMNNNRLQIYTDGACSNNQSRDNTGGYGVVIINADGSTSMLSSGYKNTTNNRMELRAVIEALGVITDRQASITISSDSQYVVKGITEWVRGWIQTGKKIKNSDLWSELYNLMQRFSNVEFKHVKGHSGNQYNEMADRLAVKGATLANLPIDNFQQSEQPLITSGFNNIMYR